MAILILGLVVMVEMSYEFCLLISYVCMNIFHR